MILMGFGRPVCLPMLNIDSVKGHGFDLDRRTE